MPVVVVDASACNFRGTEFTFGPCKELMGGVGLILFFVRYDVTSLTPFVLFYWPGVL